MKFLSRAKRATTSVADTYQHRYREERLAVVAIIRKPDRKADAQADGSETTDPRPDRINARLRRRQRRSPI